MRQILSIVLTIPVFVSVASIQIGAIQQSTAQTVPDSLASHPGLKLHVAPDGNDAASGDSTHPLASLAGARDAIRRFRASADHPVAVRVELANGRYPMTAPLEFSPEDSASQEAPVTYASAPGARPVLDGGITLKDWRVTADGTWESTIPADAGIPHCEGLWINGRRATRARTPNAGFAIMGKVTETPLAATNGKTARARQTLSVEPGIFRQLAALDESELHEVQVLIYHKWDVTRRKIHSLDAATSSLVTEGEPMKPWNSWSKGTPFVLENLPSALDAPGEWYMDDSRNILRYRPQHGETPESAKIVAPRIDRFISVCGTDKRLVRNISFQGLHFEHAQGILPETLFAPAQAASTTGAVIELTGVRRISFEDCSISHTGIWGIWFRENCQDSSVRRCHLTDLGAGAVRIGSTNIHAPLASHITVDNNILTSGGRVNPSAAGVLICHGADNQITHNEINDFFYTGISVGWVWGYTPSPSKRNHIAFNHVHRIGQGVLSDMGGIYTLGASEGTVVANNVFHDIDSKGYGGWGLYTDEGSTGILFENNLIYRTKTGGFHQHYGKENVLRNNVFIGGREQQMQATRVEPHLSFTFEKNIIWWNSSAPALRGPWRTIRFNSQDNCYWNTAAPVDFVGQALAKWQTQGHERNSLVADPQMRDPEKGDIRLKPGSPALKLGFRPFDPAQAGVYGDPAWKTLATRNAD